MKKIILSLLFTIFGLISFGYCGFLEGYNESIINNSSNNYHGTGIFIPSGSCFKSNNSSNTCIRSFYFKDINGNIIYQGSSPNDYRISLYCTDIDGYITIKTNNTECNRGIFTGVSSFFSNSSTCPECETCPEVNTGDILSGSCDTNYCVENDLCPVPSNFSQLFINDLEFPGKPLINVNIPDYIHWDYLSTDTGFDLFVGSGYDQDYIDSVLKINSYRPDSSDFTNIFVSGLTLLFPYLIFALFLVFMWKLIKRIFKH